MNTGSYVRKSVCQALCEERALLDASARGRTEILAWSDTDRQ